MISDLIGPNGRQQSKPVGSYEQSGSQQTKHLLHKNVKLVIKSVQLYGVTSFMRSLRKS